MNFLFLMALEIVLVLTVGTWDFRYFYWHINHLLDCRLFMYHNINYCFGLSINDLLSNTDFFLSITCYSSLSTPIDSLSIIYLFTNQLSIAQNMLSISVQLSMCHPIFSMFIEKRHLVVNKCSLLSISLRYLWIFIPQGTHMFFLVIYLIYNHDLSY